MTKAEFLFNINTTSGVPIYRQMLDQIYTLIASGRLTPGMFLPSIRLVGKELEINPMTVSKAYSILEREGILENVRGQGMKVGHSDLSKRDVSQRKNLIRPILEQVMMNAVQLSLTQADVVAILDSLWKEKRHE